MPKQRFGLGRGLDALIPDAAPTSAPITTALETSLALSALQEVPIESITPNPYQPRAPLTEDEALLELAASIQEHGLLQPLLVTTAGAHTHGVPYVLIAGERRWRAAQLAGLTQVPVVVKEATNQQMLELALVENLQRTDLNPLEAARGYQMLIDEYGLTQDEVADRVGRARPTVANTLRLLQLPEQVRMKLITNPDTFTEGHARAVLSIPDDDQRIQATNQIIAQGLSVREAEELARRHHQKSLLLTPDRRGGKARPQSYETKLLEDEFTRAVQLKVRLQRTTKGKGSLTLYFANEEQLQLLYQWLVAANAAQGGSGSMSGGIDINALAGMHAALSNGSTNGANGANGAHAQNGLHTAPDAADESFDVTFDDEEP